ncbi:MAG: type II secretion system protein GspD [Planctomycetes bacterium]|nr:type II secretion system protein GspD [Planctomycetota bacterium]
MQLAKKRARGALCGVLLLGASLACFHAAAAESPKLPRVEFRNVALLDALRMLSEQSGLNYSASSEAATQPISLFLRDVTPQAAVEELCKSHNLWFRLDEKTGITRVMTTQEFERDLVTFREEQTEVFTLLYPNALDVAVAINDLFGERVQLSLGREELIDESRELESRFQRFDIIDQRAQGLGLFQGGGGLSTSGGLFNNNSSGGFGGNNNGFIGGPGANRFTEGGNLGFGRGLGLGLQDRRDFTQPLRNTRPGFDEFRDLTPEQAQTLQKLLAGDAGSPESEAMMQLLRRRQATVFVTVSRRNNMVVVRSSDVRAMEEIRTLVRRLDVPTPMVLLEVKVLSVELGDGFNSMFDYQFSDGVNNAGGFSSGDIQPPAADSLSGVARKAASLALGGTGLRAGDLTFQFVNDNFRMRMQLLEDRNRVTLLATPILLTANNEVSRLFVGEERPIIRNISSQTIVADNNVATAPNTTIEFRPVGTTLLLTPNINSDRTVTLRLLQENSTIIPGGASIPVITATGAVQDQPVDVVSTRSVSGTVVAKDSLAVAIGGLIEEGLTDQRAQVPVLGKIPVLGFFFRRQSTSRSRRELVIMIRPHILSTPADGAEISRSLMRDLAIHPELPDARGTLDTFGPPETAKPNPPSSDLKAIFRIHSVKLDNFDR